MRRIAIVIDSLAGGGAEKVMLTLSTELLRLGHQVTIFSLKLTLHYDLPAGINIVHPFAKRTKSLRGLFNRAELAAIFYKAYQYEESQNGRFNLTLVNLYQSYKVASACELSNPYYIIHNSYKQELKREKYLGPLKYLENKKILSYFDCKHLLGVSQGVTNELQNASIFTPASAACMYNPFDVEQIKSLANIVPKELSPYKNTKFILHVGRAAKAKRHDVLFKALKHVDPSYQLVCLSSNTKKLVKLAKKYGVQDRVVFPGFSVNPYCWMKHASLVVLSSDFEGLSMVLIESLICETPVVSTDCCYGPNEILQDELAQYLVPPGNSDLMAQTINNALQNLPIPTHSPIIEKIGVETVAQKYLALCE